MRVALLGNLEPPHSTENEIRKALTALGHDVIVTQEGHGRMPDLDCHVALWTRTASLCERTPVERQRQWLIDARRAGVPTVAVHLDRWHGLREHGREASVWEQPYFHCEHFFSTDGAHDLEWAAAGVNHHWMPPGVSEFECEPGTPRDEWRCDVGFLGSVGGYHAEHQHRGELVQFLRETYGDRFRQFPGEGQPGIRGDDLRDLIASVKVWVGDSCLAPRADGGEMVRYWSDRVPELTGRGALLLHPEVEGLSEQHPGLPTWHMGAGDELRRLIDIWLAVDESDRQQRAEALRRHTVEHHTYTVRMAQVLEAVT